MKELVKLVLEWSAQKGINKANPNAQFMKVYEEIGETADAILKNDLHEVKDGIGDVFVTLIILNDQLGIPFDFNENNVEIASSQNPFIDMVFCVGNIGHHINNDASSSRGFIAHHTYLACESLSRLANHHNFTAKQCLQAAYDVISKRKGKMINDTFVKDKPQANWGKDDTVKQIGNKELNAKTRG